MKDSKCLKILENEYKQVITGIFDVFGINEINKVFKVRTTMTEAFSKEGELSSQ